MLAIPDDINHLTLAAQFRAGGWPPAFAWNPGISAAYHHGVDLLVGLLAPPFWAGHGIHDRVPGSVDLDQPRFHPWSCPSAARGLYSRAHSDPTAA